MNPHHPPLTASKTLHYPLPVDRHVKPRFKITLNKDYLIYI